MAYTRDGYSRAGLCSRPGAPWQPKAAGTFPAKRSVSAPMLQTSWEVSPLAYRLFLFLVQAQLINPSLQAAGVLHTSLTLSTCTL